MTLPDGIERREFDGESALATRGPVVGSEAVADNWRLWDPNRSKLAAMLELGLETGPLDGRVLYLGAAAGTTVSHVADLGGPTYAVEFAPRPVRDLVDVAAARDNLFPLLKDARAPETYAHVVEPVAVLVQDVATRGQADVALANRQFLDANGRLLLSVKARSEDVTRTPDAVYEQVLDRLETGFDVEATVDLAPFHDDHLAVVAGPA